ncbi:MAG: hypothetical protein MUF31_19070 [Akkermansiaceae bacterium]|jgi:hypothetical protein|nr:hypothetical protein [Akkermansiaceae bacterium]
MATPKGIRAKSIPINATDAVHIYSDSTKIWLQLRREHPTEDDIGITSFKAALRITPTQAIAIAGELLSVAAAQQKNGKASMIAGSPTPLDTDAKISVADNHGKPWTPEEDKQLLSRYHSKLSIEEIAKKHKRGIGGVQSRLAKHGKVIPPKTTQPKE